MVEDRRFIVFLALLCVILAAAAYVGYRFLTGHAAATPSPSPTAADHPAPPGNATATPAKAATTPQIKGRYYDKEKGFSIQFPADWERIAGPQAMGAAILALSPPEGQEDQYRENVNVFTDDAPAEKNLEEYFQETMAGAHKLLTDLVEYEKDQVTLGGVPARRIVISHRLGQVSVKAIEYVLVKGKRGYAITCSAAPEQFDKYKPTFEEIAKGFKLE